MKIEEIIPTQWINTAGSAAACSAQAVKGTEIFDKRQSTDSVTAM